MAVKIIVGDALATLRTLPDRTFQACVTSPPYYRLRDYGVAGQMGMEDTFEAYVARLVEVFQEVKRVLRDDGVVFLNLGDSYAGSWGAEGRRETPEKSGWKNSIANHPKRASRIAAAPQGCKPKDLMLIPERLILALQADGWWVRDKIVWHKPNPMPSSARDRFCPAWEPVYLLSRSARYFFDYAAAREPMESSSVERIERDHPGNAGSLRANGGTRPDRPMRPVAARLPTPAGWSDAPGHRTIHPTGRGSGNKARKAPSSVSDPRGATSDLGRSVPWEDSDGKRLMRNVWSIATEPFKEAHFATFPQALAERCVRIGSAAGDAVLDPFGGAGTVGLVAQRLLRDATLIELNPAYADMARRRIGLFAEVV